MLQSHFLTSIGFFIRSQLVCDCQSLWRHSLLTVIQTWTASFCHCSVAMVALLLLLEIFRCSKSSVGWAWTSVCVAGAPVGTTQCSWVGSYTCCTSHLELVRMANGVRSRRAHLDSLAARQRFNCMAVSRHMRSMVDWPVCIQTLRVMIHAASPEDYGLSMAWKSVVARQLNSSAAMAKDCITGVN